MTKGEGRAIASSSENIEKFPENVFARTAKLLARIRFPGYYSKTRLPDTAPATEGTSLNR